jgi:hypothetical protein
LRQFPLQFLFFILVLDVSNHAGQVSEEALGVIVYIIFLFGFNSEVILLLDDHFSILVG